MRCAACQTRIPDESRFCPSCGAAQPEPEAPAAPLVAEGRRAAWSWILGALLLLERAVAWPAFPLERAYHLTASWEAGFLWIWGLGLGLLALPLVLLRKRLGGWLAFLSGLALMVRACVPLIEEEPVGQVVKDLAWSSTLLILVFFVAGTTLTFAFLYEQGFWPGRAPEEDRDFPA
jgi:hypothetical protein